jgi:hypothetical protein
MPQAPSCSFPVSKDLWNYDPSARWKKQHLKHTNCSTRYSGCHGRSAVSISSFANGALGEHRTQDAEDHYGCGAGIGRMLDTFQPSAVFTATRFIKKRIG